MQFVHYEDKVVESGEVIEITLADFLFEAADFRRSPAANLGIDLRDVENVDRDREQISATRDLSLIVLAGCDDWRRDGELGYAFQPYFGVFCVKSVMSLL